MDISDTVAPKSDQMDYEDMLAGPKTLTITAVQPGPSDQQPFQIVFAEFARPWRPALTVRRILVTAWGPDASLYVGRKVTLFGDPTVKWAGAEVGGIRVSHLSHIDRPVTVALTVTRGNRKQFTVEPLTIRDWLGELKLAGTDLDAIAALGTAAAAAHTEPATVDKIRARYTEVKRPA